MDDTTSLDGSVGIHLGKVLTANGLSEKFGKGVVPTFIPENYRQSAANKHINSLDLSY